MANIPQEKPKAKKIPEAYKSGFTFFPSEIEQNAIATLPYGFLRARYLLSSEDKEKTIHELWRTGNIQVIYNFISDPEIKAEYNFTEDPNGIIDLIYPDQLVFICREMILEGNVEVEEVESFLNDILSASANVYFHQELGEELVHPEYVETAVTSFMISITSDTVELLDLE
ncbi:MAG: hypothetical protein UR96_C0017G0010 [candidate division WS6 bacterium GW2011_GWC1_36_11]|uniref:Uncharacterized protein n=1 Tax=candidate division WS6 bacterium GW2011_GWC1_36_11 TaxID=1619090 RepID=A0A0G0DFQ3_9BACT|nr:MAG: hypothetical protein UR96_C0017G0010 [candidate division WS6 bacterium GW2011_GWC1_36_11]KKQ04525.1 MAG: hypothetical protein US14_C0007G0008 [candidate division WS6 bacterium GW2011_WS6_36_26]HAM37765.1 hypothetical protein [Patescibacteria group bacterium]HAM96547.1 hypothetical protein [Patescibacteria group bacterium]